MTERSEQHTDGSATPTRPRRRSRRGEGDQLATEILDAAERLLVEVGDFRAVAVRRIAEEVGVTPPSIYLHFEDKNELFFAVCERRFASLAAALIDSVEGREGAVDRIEAMGRAYGEWGLGNPEHYDMLFGPKAKELAEGRDLTGSAGRLALDVLVREVEVGIDRGEITDDLAPLDLALSLWGCLHGALMIRIAKEGLGTAVPLPSREDHLDAAIAFCRRAMRRGDRPGA